MEPSLVSIGSRIREERDRLELRQSDFAELVRVSTTTQGNYERGERAPDAVYFFLAAVQGVDVLYVITGNRAPAGALDRWPEGTHPFADMTTEEAYLLRNYRATDDEGRAEVLGTSAVQVDRAERRAQKPPPVKT